MSVCQGCGTELPAQNQGRPRKWCSERCRKAQYGGTCIDCAAPTYGGHGREAAPRRCDECSHREAARVLRDRADAREAEVAKLYREGATAWQIAERLGLTVPAVKSLAKRAREHGLDCPYAPLGGHAHRARVAA